MKNSLAETRQQIDLETQLTTAAAAEADDDDMERALRANDLAELGIAELPNPEDQ